MKLIIIACCKTKKSGGHPAHKDSPLANMLGDSHFRKLMDTRRELASILNLTPGPDLGFDDQNGNIQFLPAYQRYDGIIYKRSDFENVYPQTKLQKVIIISALYGILDANEEIRNYELNMDFTLPIGRKVKTWWKNHGLGSILREIVCDNQFQVTHELLSKSYRKAIKPWPPSCVDRRIFQHEYPGQGIGSIWSRAKDLKHLLSR